MKTLLLGLTAILASLPSMLLADWSPEIILWQNPTANTSGGFTKSTMAIDARGHVHVAILHSYRLASAPGTLRRGISYAQYDDNGHIVVPEMLISDSMHFDSEDPVIRLFGQDSVWVMWWGGDNEPSSFLMRIASLDLDGNILQPARVWPRLHRPAGLSFVFDVRQRDRAVVVADGDPSDSAMNVSVELSDGTRILDDAAVWIQVPCFWPSGYIDHTDSLQLTWRQGQYLQAVYTKRISTLVPFDTLTRDEFAALTDSAGHSPLDTHPAGNSLFALLEASSEDMPYPEYLRLYQRDNYTELAHIRAGTYNLNHIFTVLGDSIISLVSSPLPGQQRGLYFREFSVPELRLLTDTLLLSPENDRASLGASSYAVSPLGIRHVIYERRSGTGPGDVRLCYRYWRADLATDERPLAKLQSEFSIYPNPTNGTFLLSGPLRNVTSAALYNILGQQVLTVNLHEQERSNSAINVNMNDLSSGAYFLHLVCKEKTIVKNIRLVR